jgi:GGDEF domain-containing protein
MSNPNVETAGGLFVKQDFLPMLAGEVADALREGRPYAVVAVAPQHFPGEDISDVMRIAAACVRDLVRNDDIAGHVEDDVVALGLHGGDCTSAAILAQRLTSDLGLRSLHLRSTRWEMGHACLPNDGSTGQELLAAAIDNAKTRRRRLAAQVMPA